MAGRWLLTKGGRDMKASEDLKKKAGEFRERLERLQRR